MDMTQHKDGRQVISVLLTEKEYEQVKILAAKENKSMSAVGREFILKGLDGEITQNNLDVIVPIIREQIKNVMEPMMERMIALSAKTCIQSGTAAYLSADAILKFVPKEQREEVRDSYDKARKKAVEYMRSKVNVNED